MIKVIPRGMAQEEIIIVYISEDVSGLATTRLFHINLRKIEYKIIVFFVWITNLLHRAKYALISTIFYWNLNQADSFCVFLYFNWLQ